MKRHVWEHWAGIKEYCVNCLAWRIAGRWHYVKRPARMGEIRKWRAPGSIMGGNAYCPGKEAQR